MIDYSASMQTEGVNEKGGARRSCVLRKVPPYASGMFPILRLTFSCYGKSIFVPFDFNKNLNQNLLHKMRFKSSFKTVFIINKVA